MFTSVASNLVPGDTMQYDDGLGPVDTYDVFLKDVLTGVTECVSVSSSEVFGNRDSGTASVSADGRYVAFVSRASNLVIGDTNATSDAFVRDRVRGTTRRISITQGGAQVYGGVADCEISANGRYVAFATSSALVFGDTNSAVDVYVRDLLLGQTTLVSLDANDQQWSDNAVNGISISGDGRRVAFCIDVNIDPGPAGYGVGQVFVRDRVLGTTIRVTGPADGLPSAGQVADSPAISADGRYVAFQSFDSELVPNDTNNDWDAFVKDLTTGRVELVSTGSTGEQIGGYMPSISGSGRFVAFYTDYLGSLIKDRVTGITRLIPGSGGHPQYSDDGRYVAFQSDDPGLVPNDYNGCSDIFRQDASSITEEFVRDTTPDPVPEFPSCPVSAKPVLVLIAGLDSDTGTYSVSGGSRAGTPGAPWDYLGSTIAANRLGVADVVVVPTAPGSSAWPHAVNDGVLDSSGRLVPNARELAEILCVGRLADRLRGHPVILVGHSYGGVIARSMLAMSLLDQQVLPPPPIAGVIQFGSPNGGANLAQIANNVGVFFPDAVYDLSRESMDFFNRLPWSDVEVPVVRFGGVYAPLAVSRLELSVNPVDKWQAAVLRGYSMAHAWKPNDGMVAYESLETGFGRLDEEDFGDGDCVPFVLAGHAHDMPGMGFTYTVGMWPGPVTTVSYEELVPQGPDGMAFTLLGAYVQSLARRAIPGAASVGVQSESDFLAAAGAEELASTAGALPQRSLDCADGAVGSVSIPLDATTTFRAVSTSATPDVAVLDSDGAAVDCRSSSGVDDDGSFVRFVTVDPAVPGTHTLEVSLPVETSSTVTLSGACSEGAQFTLTSVDARLVSMPTTLTAEFVSADGDPLIGATVRGTALLDGQADVPLVFADDGTGVDVSARDGIYSVAFTPPARGRWLVRAEAFHSSSERACSLVLHVSEQLATVTGAPSEWTAAGPGGTLASWGLSVPIEVSEEGTYTVSGALTDSAGSSLGFIRGTVALEAHESTVAVVSIDGSRLGAIASGPLTVSSLRITRYTDGIEMDTGTGPGLSTATTYSADDFYNFSVSIDGPAADPSPTGSVRFSGTAHNTPSTVASVEYSIDGSATWQPVVPVDGAFDSSHEDFTIDLEVEDYVYGIYVRQAGADGVQLPPEDWAGTRFTIDTVAPARVAELAAIEETETDTLVARVNWLPSDPPSDIASLVSYTVALDGVDVGTTCGTDLTVPLPDDGPHTISVTPIDLAGNVGIASTAQPGVFDILPPSTSAGVGPVAPDGAAGWYLTAPEIALSADEPATTYYAWDDAAPAQVLGVLTAPAGVHTLSYFSVDVADNQEDTQTATFNVDTVAPPAPTGVTAEATSYESIDLTWNEALDSQSGTAGYLVYHADGTYIGQTVETSFRVSGLDAQTRYSFYIKAKDAAGRTGAASAIAAATTEAKPPAAVVPVAGAGRVETAIEASTLGFSGGSGCVIVATARAFPDALGGSALAGVLDAPILLTEPTVLPDAMKSEIGRLGASHVIVLGGTGAVSAAVYDALDALPGVTWIERISGDDRYQTAGKIAERTIAEAGAGWDGTAFVATGETFPDALGASPVAAAKGWPIYLAHPSTTTHAALVASMEQDGVDEALILGGIGAVPATLETQLNAAFGDASVDRLSGDNRYTTAVAVARYGVNAAGLSWDRLAVTTGQDFPDALSGGALQGASSSVMLLAYPGYLHAEVANELTAQKSAITEVRFLGGLGAVPQLIRDAVVAALN